MRSNPEVAVLEVELPLGIKPTVKLSELHMNQLDRLESFDLWFVKEKLLAKKLIDENHIDEAISEFKRFIALLIIDEGGVVMYSSEVDEVWHTFILFTREYAHFCEEVYGTFIHHNPYTSRTVQPLHTFASFSERYKKVFGELSKLWKPLAGNGSSKGICQCDDVCDMPG